MLSKIRSHAQRVRHHLGSEVSFGNQRFKVHGYYANRLNISERHERNLTEVFTRQLQSRPGAFIDVGVNIGQTLCKVLGADRSRRIAQNSMAVRSAMPQSFAHEVSTAGKRSAAPESETMP